VRLAKSSIPALNVESNRVDELHLLAATQPRGKLARWGGVELTIVSYRERFLRSQAAETGGNSANELIRGQPQRFGTRSAAERWQVQEVRSGSSW